MSADSSIDWVVGAFWFFIGPIVPSIVATAVGYLAFRKKRLFLYRTLLVSGIGASLLPIYILLSFVFGGLGKQNQAGLVFVFLPFTNFFIFLVLFGLCSAAYLLARSQKDPTNPVSLATFDAALIHVSNGGLILYFVLWAVLISKSRN